MSADKPVCKPNQKYIYGVAKEENAQVICEVDAFPAPGSFEWVFNHTTKPIPEGRYTAVDNRKGISILTFSPQTELDYGILMCYAHNAVGKQADPCIFHIIPAGRRAKERKLFRREFFFCDGKFLNLIDLRRSTGTTV